MLTPKAPIAQEGIPFILYTAFLTMVSALLGLTWTTVLLLVVTSFVTMFFRDPERFIPDVPNAVVSPADGKVILADQVSDSRFSDVDMVKISIFMNVFNVHVNRSPIKGVVTGVNHVPGKFLAADHQNAHLKNEYCAVTVKDEAGRSIIFVQIAGLVARRIVCWLEKGDLIGRGERFGLIRFGSRVDIYLPKDAVLQVQVGSKVRAGESILAELN
ncbi:MAG: phosphatidylserine decarboxylase family protein [Desulfobulbaceae bacterium]|nr:MAG: phosphatidylserine decarboxylase family protein [Desulfobulbaceae bacterium]